MNRVVLMGRLTKDPELRATASGIPVCRFTVACDRRFQKQGEEKQADFIPCVAWRQQAEFLSKYFAKGHRICCEGSIQTRSWTDDKGERQFSTEVQIDHIEFAQSRGESGFGTSQPSAPSYAPQAPSAPSVPSGDVDAFMPIEEDDLPF